jgi:hypothetical protein
MWSSYTNNYVCIQDISFIKESRILLEENAFSYADEMNSQRSTLDRKLLPPSSGEIQYFLDKPKRKQKIGYAEMLTSFQDPFWFPS